MFRLTNQHATEVTDVPIIPREVRHGSKWLNTVDGPEIPRPTTVWMVLKPVVNNGIMNQMNTISTGDRRISEPSRVWLKHSCDYWTSKNRSIHRSTILSSNIKWWIYSISARARFLLTIWSWPHNNDVPDFYHPSNLSNCAEPHALHKS